ncbi:hypothetical protein CH302_03145 [Rhodococcus sp. 15-2388-1-1a]|nr:hypothetical protein CH302_03145 [Rhodococcus sp. 15-2388-1-1a]
MSGITASIAPNYGVRTTLFDLGSSGEFDPLDRDSSQKYTSRDNRGDSRHSSDRPSTERPREAGSARNAESDSAVTSNLRARATLTFA